MKKVIHYLKLSVSIIYKILMGALVGMVLGMGIGKSQMPQEKRDNKTIGSNK